MRGENATLDIMFYFICLGLRMGLVFAIMCCLLFVMYLTYRGDLSGFEQFARLFLIVVIFAFLFLYALLS